MGKTKIEWATHTWNPLRVRSGGFGCTKISAGCLNCYASRMNKRLFKGRDYDYQYKPTDFYLDEKTLEQPLHWKKPRTVFVGSMCDIFHENVAFESLSGYRRSIDRICATVASAPQHTFLFLTKRPNIMARYFSGSDLAFRVQKSIDAITVNSVDDMEIWRDVRGFEGIYEVSSLGRVRRSDNARKGRRNLEGILTPRETRGGYLAVCLSRGGVVKQCKMHRLVLEAFIGLAPEGQNEGRHINGNPTDNRLANLTWGSKFDNMDDASRHGTAGRWMKSQSTLSQSEITEIRRQRASGIKLQDIARHFQTDKRKVSAICLGKIFKPAAIQWPLPNLWLGVTAENQEEADRRIPILLSIPAAKHLVSVEPMLGPVRLQPEWLYPAYAVSPSESPKIAAPALDWVIVGGESGPGARPMHPDWVRSLRDQCVVANVPFFLKQMMIDGKMVKTALLDGRTWEQRPE